MTQTSPMTAATLPDVALPTLDGDVLQLTELRGKRFLLYMWASW